MHNALAKPGGETITIRGSRQVGKTSLLIRGMHEAQRIKVQLPISTCKMWGERSSDLWMNFEEPLLIGSSMN